MYEASFGLKRRPFAATPDATCFLAAGPIQAALDEVVICVQQGQGIAVLTSPAGTGKTLLCERLRLELDERYETVFLRHASFLTRRALLQTVLCELNHAYHHPSEQELRLELFPAIRALQPKREALVLICDEAHQLSDSLLEELRILADFAEAGQPLVRLVLVGQPSLEEKLAQVGLEAFNQRIRAHISLNTFDHSESLDYLDYRVTWAGGRTDEIFTPEALDLVARASDGVPRCMNQLADHSLLLAYVAEQHPVSEELVREALHDLRQLPLHWNEQVSHRPSTSDERTTRFETAVDSGDDQVASTHTTVHQHGETYSFEPEPATSSQPPETISFEFGTPVATFATDSTESIGRTEMGTDDWQRTIDAFTPRTHESILIEAMKGLLPEPMPVVESEATREKLSRRIDFHELLHDAYTAASERSNERGHAAHGTDQYKAHFVSGAPSSATNNATFDDFQEELVVDRYTSIDAGFAPPAISVPDTPKFEQVHPRPVESQNDEVPGDRVVDVRKHRDSSSFESIIASLNIGAGDDETTAGVEVQSDQSLQFDRDQARVHDATEISTYPQTLRLPDDVDEVARNVYSLGESLRTSGALSSTTDSILKSIHSEMGGESYSTETESVPQPPPVPAGTIWEAVETEDVTPQGTESRPFRYLFSMLRRKQKGL